MNSERIKSLSTRFKNERSTLNSKLKLIKTSHYVIATIKYLEFKKVLDEEFKGKKGYDEDYKSKKPAETLVYCMFDRKLKIIKFLHLCKGFRKFKFNDQGTEIDKRSDMDILDYLLAMNLLARIVYDKKLRCNTHNFKSINL